MPINRSPKSVRSGAGRKKQKWTAERKAIAERIARVRDAYGSGNKLREVAGRTSLDWCVAPAESFANKRTPDVPNLLAFARATGRRVEWLLTGAGPEHTGELVPRAELAAAFAAHGVAACERAWLAQQQVAPPFGAMPWGADAETLLREVTAHVVRVRIAEEAEQQRIASVMRPVSEMATTAKDGADTATAARVDTLLRQVGERTRFGSQSRTFAVGPMEQAPLPLRGKAPRRGA